MVDVFSVKCYSHNLLLLCSIVAFLLWHFPRIMLMANQCEKQTGAN